MALQLPQLGAISGGGQAGAALPGPQGPMSIQKPAGMPMPQASPPVQAQVPPPPVYEGDHKEESQENKVIKLQDAVNSVNVAEDLPDEELAEYATDLVRRIKEDELSMWPWLQRYDEYLKLALQVKEKKTFPWKGAANIKYPIVTIAALQFHARAYPAIVNNKSLVRGKVVGYDPSGKKAERAERIGKHMSYQLMEEVNNWDEDMDKLCLILPIAGCVFKQVSWDTFEEKIASDLILPTDMIVNYWASSLEDARRVTRRRYFYKNTIIEYQRDGKFLDVELPEPKVKAKEKEAEDNQLRRFYGHDAEDVPYELYECQTWLDLDLDGYKEPYTVLLEPNTPQILRITPNYSLSDIKKNSKGEIVRIKQRKQFIKFDFIPAPDGGLLGVGFGLLLGSLNEVVNTALNQLLDQGTMKTTAGGFVAKGIKLSGGKLSFAPNEWKVVQTSSDDLRKSIVPLPVGEPSAVLFELLQAIDAKSSQVIAISEISTGKLPGQNTPATTTVSSLEEGMKLFNAIFKRIWRQLKKEFKIIFEVNQVHLTDEAYFTMLDSDGTTKNGKVSKEDYNSEDMDVTPEADPTVVPEAMRLMKAQQLQELIPLGAVDPAKAGQRILVALDQPNPQELAPQPQPNPDMVKAQADIQAKQQAAQIDAQSAQHKQQLEQQKSAHDMQIERIQAQQELSMKAQEQRMDQMSKMMELKFQELQSILDLKTETVKHKRELDQADEKHQQKMRHAEEQNAIKKAQKAKPE